MKKKIKNQNVSLWNRIQVKKQLKAVNTTKSYLQLNLKVFVFHNEFFH